MSGIAGIFNVDGAPVDRDLLARMIGAARHRGPDGLCRWSAASVGLAHALLRTTPESLRERQPLLDETGQLALTLDGRVDNRADLGDALLARGARLRDDTDAELVLKAYDVWGDRCPERILGDFALAVWDGRRRALFCARDILGARPFYYRADPRSFSFASELQQLLQDPRVPREPNENLAGELLAGEMIDAEATLVRGVLRLPPAHCLVVPAGGPPRRRRYWRPEPAPRHRRWSDDDCAARLLELLTASVKCRLRSQATVGAHLSGGLDSTAIVGVAHQLVRAGAAAAPGLECFSLVFPGDPDADESAYIDDMVDMWRLSSRRVPAAEAPLVGYAEAAAQSRDFPGYPSASMFDPLMVEARRCGVRVMLTGQGGDDWFCGTPRHLAGLVRSARLRPLAGELRSLVRTRGPVGAAAAVARDLAAASLPARWRLRLAEARGRAPRYPWIREEFAGRTGLARRLREAAVRREGCATPARYLAWLAGAASAVHGRELDNRYHAAFGIEARQPFEDRRVVEFALSLPEDQRKRGATHKVVLRRAMAGLAPERIRARTGKANFSAVFPRAIRREAARVEGGWAIADAGWVDGAQLDAMVRRVVSRFESGDRYMDDMWHAWAALGLELWLTQAAATSARDGRSPHLAGAA